MTDLAGKVAIVTGSAQGLGLGIARSLRKAGARVAMVDINGAQLACAIDEVLHIEGSGPEDARAFVVDLKDVNALRELPKQVNTAFGRIDILVNNAGVRSISPFLDQPLEEWQLTMDINLTAPFLLCQETIPHMIAQGGGKIVNITSVAAELGFKERSAYNASKAGLKMLTKSIALELAHSGINCNAVAPGIIETSLNSNYFLDPDFTKVIVDNTPAGTWGKPADIGAAVLFLCGPDSDFINGVTLSVDGGWSTGKGY